MNHDSHSPLDPQERALADALANLPALDPPSELDAKVLADARTVLRSTMTAPRRSTLRWLTAGFGSAAVTVLAAGIAWQAGFFDLNQGQNETGSHAPTARMSKNSSPSLHEAPTPMAAPAPPPEPMVIENSSPSSEVSEDSAHAPSASAAHAQEAATSRKQQRPARPPPAAGNDARKKDRAGLQQRSVPPPAPPAPPAPMPKAEQTLDSVTVSGSRLRLKEYAIPPDWRNDADLATDAWLDRVRTRLHQGDRDGARASLRSFVEKHPTHVVPDDLVGLLEK